MNVKQHSVCTLSLALTLAMHPGLIAEAASHCKGLEQQVCGTTAACRWQEKREPAMGVSARKAHCRLDVAAAAKLAAQIAKGKSPSGN